MPRKHSTFRSHTATRLDELEPRIVPANTPPALVRDINTMPLGSHPTGFTELNGFLYFAATDPVHGEELWRSNGSSSGTVLVRDIRPGPQKSYLGVTPMVNAGGVLYFAANDGVHGLELWRSDGTSSGTVMVRDISAGDSLNGYGDLTAAGGVIFFVAMEAATGRELWTSDGTSSGTVLVRDFHPGTDSSEVYGLFNFGGTLFFNLNGSVEPPEFWRSNGTSTGTQLVTGEFIYDIYPVIADGVMYFSGYTPSYGLELWRSDGTSSGTSLVRDIIPGVVSSSPGSLTNVGGTLYFFAGPGLWRSNGTSAGTTLVRSLPGSFGNSTLTNVNGMLYFVTNDGISGQELWRSDGTSSGTGLFADIMPGFPSSYPERLTNAGGTLFFKAGTGLGNELWRSDGTSSGTVLVRDINTGGSSNPAFLTNINGTLYFAADDYAGFTYDPNVELWKSDGTSSGTVLVRDINTSTQSADFSAAFRSGDFVYYISAITNFSFELWRTDGTSSGTIYIRQFPRAVYPVPYQFTDVGGGAFYFTITNDPFGYTSTLWRCDGGQSYQVPGVENPSYLENVGGILYFQGLGPDGAELWRTDGTSSGTHIVRDINVGSNSYPIALTNVNGLLFFAAYDATGDRELWRSDGTSSGTVLVRDIRPGPVSSQPFHFTNVAGRLVFSANNGTSGFELWQSDGTSSGTVLVRDIFPGPLSSNPDNPFVPQFVAVDDLVFFSANTSATGRELWVSDGTSSGTHLVSDVNPGPLHSIPFGLTNVNGTLFFVSFDPASGYELRRSDGIDITLVRDINPGTATSLPRLASSVNFGDVFYFSASDGVNGVELWRSDGTSSGTTSIDFEPGHASNPTPLGRIGDTLLMAAFRSDVGQELFSLRELPSVSDITVNAGATQRSRITTVTATFDGSTDVSLFQNPGAVALTRTAGGPATVVTIGSGLVITPGAGNSNSITLTFQNANLSGVENGSLADGRWQLAIPSLNYQSTINDPNLRRLFGDVNADGTVDATDFGAFGAAFGGAIVAFDFDNNGTIDAGDFGQFGARFGLTL